MIVIKVLKWLKTEKSSTSQNHKNGRNGSSCSIFLPEYLTNTISTIYTQVNLNSSVLHVLNLFFSAGNLLKMHF